MQNEQQHITLKIGTDTFDGNVTSEATEEVLRLAAGKTNEAIERIKSSKDQANESEIRQIKLAFLDYVVQSIIQDKTIDYLQTLQWRKVA